MDFLVAMVRGGAFTRCEDKFDRVGISGELTGNFEFELR